MSPWLSHPAQSCGPKLRLRHISKDLDWVQKVFLMGCAGASYLGVQNRGGHRAEEGKMPRLTYVWIRKRDILKFMSMPLSNGNFFYSKHFKQWIVLPLSLDYGNCSEALWEAAKVPCFLVPQVSQGGSLREMFFSVRFSTWFMSFWVLSIKKKLVYADRVPQHKLPFVELDSSL